jgi:hypothetical protein
MTMNRIRVLLRWSFTCLSNGGPGIRHVTSGDVRQRGRCDAVEVPLRRAQASGYLVR